MNKTEKTLYAIYKNEEHKGNERGDSTSDAIRAYVIASDFEYFLNDQEFMAQYSAKKAENGVHHHFIEEK